MTLAGWLFQVLEDEKVINVVERGEPNNAKIAAMAESVSLRTQMKS
jgi:hypothetical protein